MAAKSCVRYCFAAFAKQVDGEEPQNTAGTTLEVNRVSEEYGRGKAV